MNTDAQKTGPMTSKPAPLITVAVPAYNEVENIPKLCEELDRVLRCVDGDYEVVFADDGSSDGSRELLRRMHEKDPRIRFVSFSRNFGHQAALVAGLDHSRGRAVISMDADLQHPPDLLPEMIARWREGYKVVYTTKRSSAHVSLYRRTMMRVGYGILSRVSGMNLRFGQSDFRLLDRAVVDTLCSFPERDKLLRGLVDWVGYKRIGLAYDVPPRFAGEAKYTSRALLRLVTSGVYSYTIAPLRLFTTIGVGLSILSFLYGIFVVVARVLSAFGLLDAPVPSGWASLTCAVTFLCGIQLIGIGLLGEYIGRIYDEAKRRPVYIVEEQAQDS